MNTSTDIQILKRRQGLLLSLAAICLIGLALPENTMACHRGTPHGQQTDCGPTPPSPDEVTYDVTYEFGELAGDVCGAPDCVTTSVTATGTLECGNLYCLFHSNSVSDDFLLPPGLRELIFATEWRGTPLDPDLCFGSTDSLPGSAFIDHTQLELRAYYDDATPWFAQVHAVALDTEGLEYRDYTFNFQGCGIDSCGEFVANSVAGDYLGGELIRIDGKGPDRKFLSVPCRCTMSNTPDCPGDVPLPTPPIRISVTEVP
jgi:hypothetical protein